MAGGRADRAFYRQDVVTLAQRLLGCHLVRQLDGQRLVGRVVETEAYLGIPDDAAHTFAGRRTPRNEPMWQDGGTLYVYFTYGMHHCMNVVAQAAEEPVAVLIRALEPIDGLDTMRHRRPKAKRDTDLTSGPAKLCQALGITREHCGLDLCTDAAIWLEPQPAIDPAAIATGPRVGIDYATGWKDRPLRFAIHENPHVSRPWPWPGRARA